MASGHSPRNQFFLFFEIGEDEIAKELTGVLNSIPVRVYAGSYALRVGGKYFHYKTWTISIVLILDEIFYSGSDSVTDLAEQLYEQEGDDDLSEELDDEIATLYGLSDSEVNAILDDKEKQYKNGDVSLRVDYDDDASTILVEMNLDEEASIQIELSELSDKFLAASILREVPTYSSTTSVAGP